MLLQLPKDVLTYILSIVVFETYITQVSPFVRSTTFLIDELTRPGAFTCFVDNSITMVPLMKTLSLIHPSIHKLLLTGCKKLVGGNRWSYKRSFFNTLLPHK